MAETPRGQEVLVYAAVVQGEQGTAYVLVVQQPQEEWWSWVQGISEDPPPSVQPGEFEADGLIDK